MAGLDAITAQALDIISSNRVRDAFDIEQGTGEAQIPVRHQAGGVRLRGRRRTCCVPAGLVEAGVSVVTVAIHGWDTHENNFEFLRKDLPLVDQAVHALVTDLEERGLLDDVAILMGGEMGRTPKIIAKGTTAGRDHWPQTGITIMAGGGLQTGQVVGASDAEANSRRAGHHAADDDRDALPRPWHRPGTTFPTTTAGRCTCSTNASRSRNCFDSAIQIKQAHGRNPWSLAFEIKNRGSGSRRADDDSTRVSSSHYLESRGDFFSTMQPYPTLRRPPEPSRQRGRHYSWSGPPTVTRNATGPILPDVGPPPLQPESCSLVE